MGAEAFPSIRDVSSRRRRIHPTAAVSALADVGAPAEARDRLTEGLAIVAEGATIREFVRVHAGCERDTTIGRGTLLMAGSHVGHDAVLGAGCEVAPNAVIGGHCTIGDNVRIGMNATLLPYVEIGDNARVGAGAVVTKDIPAGETWVGNPARKLHAWRG